jgi:hypothetical protein
MSFFDNFSYSSPASPFTFLTNHHVNEQHVCRTIHEEFRWPDQEPAVLSTCSSLIAIVEHRNSRRVEFSHSSVKEFLTSDRLATSELNALHYHHIQLELAHAIMAQACQGVLFRLDDSMDKKTIRSNPLVRDAVESFLNQSRRSHSVLNTSATARRMKKDAEDKKVRLYLIPAGWYSSNNMISRFQRSRRLKCVRPRRMSLSHAHYIWRRATSWSIKITFLSRKKRGSGLMLSGQQFPVLS